jgi:uncharacterized damage-inducible protein DinB
MGRGALIAARREVRNSGVMRLIDLLLAEFDREHAVTRCLLERVPDDRATWRPHPLSRSLGDLAIHLAELPARLIDTLHSRSSISSRVAPARPPHRPGPRATRCSPPSNHRVASARAVLAASADAELQAPWTLKNAGHPLFTAPKASALRTWVFNHAVHHRGQLSVYLRLCGVPLPAMYGPTADVPF